MPNLVRLALWLAALIGLALLVRWILLSILIATDT